MNITLGIDIGGTAIKAALVDTQTGRIIDNHLKIPTPSESSPNNILSVVQDLVKHFNWHGLIGCAFPGVIIDQVIKTSANLHKSCINTNLSALIQNATGCPTWTLNDADSAAFSEILFGSAQGFKGSGLMITIGTGIGSALFYNGNLFPNTELGHLIINGTVAETIVSAAVIKKENLSWELWSERFNQYLTYVHSLFWPQLIILGGGISKEFNQFGHLLNIPADILPAKFQNYSGIVGAALAATKNLESIRR